MRVLLCAPKGQLTQLLESLMRNGRALGVQLPVVVFGIGRVKLFRPWKSCHANDAIVPPHRLAVALQKLAERGLLREKREADERDAGKVAVLLGLSSSSFSSLPSSSNNASSLSSSVEAARDRRRQRALEVIMTTQGFRRILLPKGKTAGRGRKGGEAEEKGEGEARVAVVHEATSPTGGLWTSPAQPVEGPSGAVRFLRWLVHTVEEGLNVDAFRRLNEDEARWRLAVCGNLPGDVLDLIRDYV